MAGADPTVAEPSPITSRPSLLHDVAVSQGALLLSPTVHLLLLLLLLMLRLLLLLLQLLWLLKLSRTQ